MTHEFLSHMLGVRRGRSDRAALSPSAAEAVEYSRGNISILDDAWPRGRLLRLLRPRQAGGIAGAGVAKKKDPTGSFLV